MQHILFKLCNATPAMLPPDIERRARSPQAVRLQGGGGNGNCLGLQLPLRCNTAIDTTLPMLVTAGISSPSLLVPLFPSLSMQHLLNAFSFSSLLPGQEWPCPSSLNFLKNIIIIKKKKVLPSQLRSLNPALALPLLEHLSLYNFFCLAPIFLRTSLQTLDLPFSHHSMVHFSYKKLDLVTSFSIQPQLKRGNKSELLILRPVPLTLTLPLDATKNAW